MKAFANLQELYEIIGKIVEVVQTIEWNVGILIGINPKESSFTAGELKHMCDDLAVINFDDSKTFSKILRGRNYLIHNFFKLEAPRQWSQSQITTRVSHLWTFFERTNEFNNRLVLIIDKKQVKS